MQDQNYPTTTDPGPPRPTAATFRRLRHELTAMRADLAPLADTRGAVVTRLGELFVELEQLIADTELLLQRQS